jgi:hypothetical protein
MRKTFLLILLACAVRPAISQTLVIPTVVHVVYRNASQDLSDEAVRRVLDTVNMNFKGISPNQVVSRLIFDSLIANTEIQLRLATRDTAGNPTTGIVHQQVSYTPLLGDLNFGRSNSPAWDDTRYLNLWIIFGGPGSAIMGGLSSGPTNTTPPPSGFALRPYGITVNHDAGTYMMFCNYITHEAGHFFGLFHTFTEDYIDDTPCSSDAGLDTTQACNPAYLTLNTCSAEAAFWNGINPPDMIENFMAYHAVCAKMFTKGQKQRMRNAVNTSMPGILANSIVQFGSTSGIPLAGGPAEVRITPNPAADMIRIEGIHGKASMSFINSLGQLALRVTDVHDNDRIDIKALSPGVYQIVLQSMDGTQSSRLLRE